MKKLKNIFVNGAIHPEQIARSIQSHNEKKEIGAHSIFLGQVRDDQKGAEKVQLIRYTAYEQMANEKATEIREELFSKYDLTCMHLYHSLGEVKAGEICLFVFVSSGHRKAAMDACNELVESVKKELPIWGEEVISKNASFWKENKDHKLEF